jgi:hypothetical protein
MQGIPQMQPPHWQQEQQTAQLVMPRFSAALDVTRPQMGLGDLKIDGTPLPSCAVLQVGGASLDSSPDVVESYVRGGDMVATYQSSDSKQPHDVEQISPQIYWRALPSPDNAVIALIELLVSVQTDLLESHPALAVTAQLPACETARLLDAESGQFQPMALTSDASLALDASQGPGAILFRLADDRYSFGLFVHPADFQQITLILDDDSPRTLRVSHALLGDNLEKGVIRRARCQGIFLDRADDATVAAECYRRFALTAPPLTT